MSADNTNDGNDNKRPSLVERKRRYQRGRYFASVRDFPDIDDGSPPEIHRRPPSEWFAYEFEEIEERRIETLSQEQPNTQTAGADKHLVILVHGIRTRADWYAEVRDALQDAGFDVGLTNYERFDLFRFLLPIPFVKGLAAAKVEQDIRAAMTKYEKKEISIIAHSFGTYVVARIIKKKFDIKFRHIIFCGSVVKVRFPFEQFQHRFLRVINEVGTKDIWPVLAVSAAWGYGPAGAYGFKRGYAEDRYHRGKSHSAFLNATFCKEWWIPILQGKAPKRADLPEKPPLWLSLLAVFHLKYILLIALVSWTLFSWCRAPSEEVFIRSQEIVFVGQILDRIAAQAEEPCSGWCPELLRCKKCMLTTEIETAVKDLVVCRPRRAFFRYRDPSEALQRLSRELPTCVVVDGIAERRLSIRLDRTTATEVSAADGRSRWTCGCNAEEKRKLQAIINR